MPLPPSALAAAAATGSATARLVHLVAERECGQGAQPPNHALRQRPAVAGGQGTLFTNRFKYYQSVKDSRPGTTCSCSCMHTLGCDCMPAGGATPPHPRIHSPKTKIPHNPAHPHIHRSWQQLRPRKVSCCARVRCCGSGGR